MSADGIAAGVLLLTANLLGLGGCAANVAHEGATAAPLSVPDIDPAGHAESPHVCRCDDRATAP
ncbi:hypothetical protein J7E97_13885 [Streptomyces sp. ISL-66]|uniref:hypothetical protein n=1 Tax=Streptomyces sp. ISL-66 TaxID=2819186 RepID=UPI001BE9A2FE|nr:hypothetical protein [Streptomyces sp. ISL-66]MBT2468934.1 hypothetical protein [Streptomyces sp. ISL-66]